MRKQPPLKRGDLVRMTHQFKSLMKSGQSFSKLHIKEFGRCVGMVLGPVDWANGTFGPEIDVRWKPSGLRYMYSIESLQVVRRS